MRDEIRRALRDQAHAMLQTVPRRGYRLVLPDRPATPARHRRWQAAAVVGAALVLSLGAWWGREPPAAPLSVAVLPFDDLGGEARQARFADAFTEDLITELARADGLRVIARNSVEVYADRAVDVREIGRELGVTHVLEGSLELPPGRIRVTAQLIDAGTGAHVWSERFDRPADDLFAVRDQVLTRLVGTLTGYDGPLWREWIEAAKRRPPADLRAFDYMLMAQEPYRRHDQAGVAEARDLLLKAVALDPWLARAWDFLANCYMQEAINGWGDRAAAWERYRDATRRAAALDPADGHIQLSLGYMYFERGDTALGIAAWERALELAPNDALVNRAIGTMLPIIVGVERADGRRGAGGAGARRARPAAPALLLAEPGDCALLCRALFRGGRGAAQDPRSLAGAARDARAGARPVRRARPGPRPGRRGAPPRSGVLGRGLDRQRFIPAGQQLGAALRRGRRQRGPSGLHRHTRGHRAGRPPGGMRGRPARLAAVTISSVSAIGSSVKAVVAAPVHSL